MPKFTYAKQKIIDSLQRELDEVEKTWPMTHSYERIDPYITPYLQGGKWFEVILYHVESRTWYNEAHPDYIVQQLLSHQVINPNDIIFDLGSNAGTISIVMASLAPQGHVYAFDPFPWNPIATRHNALLNGLTNVTAFPVGISSADSSIKVSPNESRTYAESADSFNVIEIHNIKRYAHLRPTFIKLDIEGAEHDLMVAVDEDSLATVQGFVLELHPMWLRPRGVDPADTLKVFHKLGYTLTADVVNGAEFNLAHYHDAIHVFWGKRKSA